MAAVVEALSDGCNAPFVYHRLLPRFVDTANFSLPDGASQLVVCVK